MVLSKHRKWEVVDANNDTRLVQRLGMRPERTAYSMRARRGRRSSSAPSGSNQTASPTTSPSLEG
jgi:hypothetical protein